MARVLTVNDVLDGHVVLDIECLDRIYLNAYVPILQTSSQVVAFLSGHLGFPFPSPALFRQMGDRFRKAVLSFSDANDIPWVRFEKDEAKLEVMQPHLARQAGTGKSGVAAIGVAQEFQRVWTASQGKTSTGTPRWSFVKTDRRVTCYYFYLWDQDFGPAFIKVCAYFPYPAKIWVNGHEWVKRQAERAGLGVTALSNGFAACEDPAALQAICDRLGPGTINVFVQRWLHRLPLPLGPADRDAGYWRGNLDAPGGDLPHHGLRRAPACPRLLRGAGRRQPRHRPAAQRRDHLRPEDPPRHPGDLPHRDRPPRQRRRHRECVLQALTHQAVPQRRAGDADRDRRQRPPRPGLQRPPAPPR